MRHQKHSIITLKHLLIEKEKQIGIKFNPNKMVQTVIKGLPEIKWSKKYGMAYLKNNSKNVELIFNDFKGIAWVNGSHFFTKKSNAK